jgi:hypothetical protein
VVRKNERSNLAAIDRAMRMRRPKKTKEKNKKELRVEHDFLHKHEAEEMLNALGIVRIRGRRRLSQGSARSR